MSLDLHWILDIVALVPLSVVFISMLFFRKSAQISSLIGISIALLLSICIGFEWQITDMFNILFASLLLTLNVAYVILPGLMFNSLIRRQGLTRSLAQWIFQLPISKEAKTLLILLGLAPAVESLTGFGISIFLTIPILYSLYSLNKTMQLGLISIHIMPWGTLGLATLIGSMLTGLESQKLGILTSWTSSLIFPYLGVVSAYLISETHHIKNMTLAFVLGSLLSLHLIICNQFLNVEVAGVISGFCVCIIGLYFLKKGSLQLKQGLVLFFPYMILLGFVLIQRMIPGLYETLSEIWVLKTQDVSFRPLTSPGTLLILVILTLLMFKPSCYIHINMKEVFQKSKKAITGIGLFLLLSQILVQTEMLDALINQVRHVFTQKQILILSPFLGMLSGLTTGSNVGGNALLINAQYKLGNNEGLSGLLAALQNSSAGHAVFSSIPMILLFLEILRDQSGKKVPPEYKVLRFTLLILIGILILLSLTGYILAQIMGYVS